MKKLLILLLILSLALLSSCDIGGDKSYVCEQHEDADANGLCDTCGGPVSTGTGGESCAEHKDDDDNGKCDTCSVSVLVYIDFYAVNDLHGKLCDTDIQPGVDELTTYLKAASSNKNAVILSSGDMWQGSPESNLTGGRIVTDWMNEVGFVSMTLGNHEYDWGVEYIEQNQELAAFPFLAINVYDRATETRVDYADASVVVERDGIQIGIIGAIGDCYSSISSDKVEDIYFKTGKELTALVKNEATRLRAEGVDFIVYSLHDGWNQTKTETGLIGDSQLSSYYDPSLSEGYVDLVFEAHTHQRYVMYDSDNVYHLQGSGENKGISYAKVSVNSVTGTSSTAYASFVSSNDYKLHEPDGVIDDLIEKYDDEISVAYRVLGNNSHYRNSTYVRNLVARLYLEAGLREWESEYEIFLGGGFISVRSPYNLSAGEVTYGDLQMLLPFDNQLVLCSIKGSDLRTRFLETDNENYFIALNPGVDPEDIDDDKIYYVITDTYCSSYAWNRLTVVAEYAEGIYARDLVAEYIENGGLEDNEE